MNLHRCLPMLALISCLLMFAASLNAQPVPPKFPTNGLVGWWPFNGNAHDESGSGNHGVVYGATLTEDRFGNPNSAYYFALFDYIETPFLGVGGSSERTIAFWMKNRYGQRTLTPTRYGGGSTSYGDAFWTGMNRNHQHDPCKCWPTIYEGMGVDGGHLHLVYETEIGDSATWHHYAWVVPPGAVSFRDVKMFRDGLLISKPAGIVFDYNDNSNTLALNTNVSSTEPFIIGRSLVVPTSPAGSKEDMGPSEYLDDVAFWSRALSDEEITSMYNDGVVNSTADPSRNDDLHTMQLTPNPASSTIEIAWTEYNGAHTKIDIVSLTGEVVMTLVDRFVVAGRMNVSKDLSQLSSGIYAIRSVQNNVFSVRTFIISR